MKLQIFSLRDIKTDQFGNPMFLQSTGQAIRSVADEVNKPSDGNMLHAHPEDFELYLLGDFDTVTGLFATGTPSSVALLSNLKVSK